MTRPYPKFEEWLAMREGLRLADKNAALGMSRIDPLPAMRAKLKSRFQTKPKLIDRFKAGQVSKPSFLRTIR